MGNDTISKTVLVATLLCLVCSVMVSTAATFLKPQQERNEALSTKKNILEAAGLMERDASPSAVVTAFLQTTGLGEEGGDVEELFKKIQVRVVDLETGEFDDSIDATTYDQKEAAKDPTLSIVIPDDKNLANIGQRAKKALVYFVSEGNQLKTIILPIHGKGLWSTMYAFLALEGDGNTVKGYAFYDHGETPGLGGEVDNALWKRQWIGKKIYDRDWNLAVDILKGKVDPNKPEAIHQADGLAGATLTTVGVENLMRYWLGEHGFDKFLARLRKQGAHNG